MSKEKSIRNLYKERASQSPEEALVVCPNCQSTSTTIEKWERKYPFIRCLKCGIAFYSVEFRSACTYWKQSVTQDQCKACFQYNPTIQCKDWNGILPPPPKLAEAINIQLERKKRVKLFQPPKESFQVR